MEVLEGRALLVKLPLQMDVGWRNDLLEVEYDSSAKKNYSAMPMQAMTSVSLLNLPLKM